MKPLLMSTKKGEIWAVHKYHVPCNCDTFSHNTYKNVFIQ